MFNDGLKKKFLCLKWASLRIVLNNVWNQNTVSAHFKCNIRIRHPNCLCKQLIKQIVFWHEGSLFYLSVSGHLSPLVISRVSLFLLFSHSRRLHLHVLRGEHLHWGSERCWRLRKDQRSLLTAGWGQQGFSGRKHHEYFITEETKTN